MGGANAHGKKQPADLGSDKRIILMTLKNRVVQACT
jgi:hypothetical protein